MFFPSRRRFLGASLSGLVTTPLLAAGQSAPANPVPIEQRRVRLPAEHAVPHLAARPDHDHDRAVGRHRRGDGRHDCLTFAASSRSPAGPATGGPRSRRPKPYPKTDFKVFRAELTRSVTRDRLPVPDRQAVAGVPVPHDAGEGDRHDPLRLRRRLRRERPRGRQQHPGRPAGPDVRGHRRRPGLRQRPVGRGQPRVPAQLQQAHDRPRRPADPDGHVHRQPRGRRRLQQAAREGPVLLRPVRRPVPRDRATRRSTSATT